MKVEEKDIMHIIEEIFGLLKKMKVSTFKKMI